jgi:hypothetical protein
MTIVRRQRVVPWFLGTRLVMFLLALDVLKYFNHVAIIGDVQLYDFWITKYLQHGEFPLDDHRWQYPPGAAGPILLPELFDNAVIPGSYIVAFFTMCLVADAVVFWLLLRAARAAASPDQPSAAGPWLWTLGVVAIGPMAYGRYDLVVTAIAVAALCVTLKTERATLAARGVLIGLGTFIKVWPAAILFGAPKGRRGRLLVGAATVTLVVPTFVLRLAIPGVLSFVTNQKGRSIQIESVFATPFLVGRWFGWHGHVENTANGAFEFIGPGVTLAATLAMLATAAGFGVLLWIRRRAARSGGFQPALLADVALAATLVAMVTSRVLSPQYLIWILGLAAVCLTRRDTVQRLPAWIVLGAVSVTQLIFPLFYHTLRGGQISSGLILFGRNGALVAATVFALMALWRASAAGPESGPDSAARLGDDVSLPLGGEVLGGGAENAAEGLVDRVDGPGRRGADRIVERD